MPKARRSFFERLTGSVSYEDEPESSNTLPESISSEPANDWLKEKNEEGELAVDVYQTPREIVVRAMIAGVKPEDLQISISREMVTVKGKREETEVVAEEDYFQKELYWGSFSKTILLPAEVEAEEAEATEKHGLLMIRLPKIDKEKVQRLKVRSI